MRNSSSTCQDCGGGLPPCAGCDEHAYPCLCDDEYRIFHPSFVDPNGERCSMTEICTVDFNGVLSRLHKLGLDPDELKEAEDKVADLEAGHSIYLCSPRKFSVGTNSGDPVSRIIVSFAPYPESGWYGHLGCPGTQKDQGDK